MSIWNDCDAHEGSIPFYGFPVIPSLNGNILRFDFPKGYEPNGSQTKEVAEKMVEKFGGKVLNFGEKHAEVEINPQTVAYILVHAYCER